MKNLGENKMVYPIRKCALCGKEIPHMNQDWLSDHGYSGYSGTINKTRVHAIFCPDHTTKEKTEYMIKGAKKITGK